MEHSGNKHVMTDDELEATEARLGVLKKAGYPIGKSFRHTFKDAVGDSFRLEEEADPFADRADKRTIDETLANWASGKLNVDNTLNQMLPFLLCYYYGGVSDKQLQSKFLRQRRDNCSFAKVVMDAWDAVLTEAPDDVSEAYVTAHFGIGIESDHGLDETTFLMRIAHGRISCWTPNL